MEEQKECTNQSCDCANTECKPETTTAEAPKKPELTEAQLEKLEKQKAYFMILRQGALFLRFVLDDFKKQTFAHCNRFQRRRIEKELKKGIISKELVELYMEKIDILLQYIAEQTLPKTTELLQDGAEFYNKAKEAEAKGELKEEQK